MKKIAVLFYLFSAAIIFPQQIKFAIISNPGIYDSKSVSVLDSTISFINRNDELDFVVVTGSLTANGLTKEADVFINSISKISKNIYILQGTADVRDANGLQLLNEISTDKFSIKSQNYSIVGLSPVIPLTNLNHFSLENLEWFSSALDTINIGDDYIFISPFKLENKTDNWETIFSMFNKKNPDIIIYGGSEKLSLRNFKGYTVLDIPSVSLNKNKLPDFFTVNLSKDSISIFDSSGKLFSVIDKSIAIEKDSISIPAVETFNADIEMNSELNSTMITSTSFWNKHIYTFDESGLITCMDSTGNIMWDYDAGGNIYGKSVLADGIITFATFQGDITSVSGINGEQIQSIGFEENITSDLSLINYEGNRELMIPKLSESKSAIVFGTADGKVLCYDLETLQQYWVNDDAGGMVREKPIYSQNKILFTSRDGYIYCIDARDGLLIWRWKEKADTDLSGSPIYSNGKSVFVVSEDGIVYSINLLLGKLEWKLDKVNGSSNFGISDDNSSLLLFSRNNSFYIIDAAKGKITKEIKAAGSFYESLGNPVKFGDNIFYSSDGMIYKLNGKNIPDKLIFAGTSPLHTLINISGNKFLVSNADGRIIVFTLR